MASGFGSGGATAERLASSKAGLVWGQKK